MDASIINCDKRKIEFIVKLWILFLIVVPISRKFSKNLLNSVTETQQQQERNITHTTTTLSQARYWLAATSSGELVFFGGGYNSTGEPSDQVDIYNVTSGRWTTATLSIPRYLLAATSSQNFVFFGGGWNGTSTYFDRVDIYNTLNGSWSTATLSQPRYRLAATSVGNLVLFGGGYNSIGYSNVVDVFDVTSNRWTTATLSHSCTYLAATSVDNRYALFGGGLNGSGPSNVVDIFDSLSRIWNTTTLSQARSRLASTSLGKLAFFGGGQTNGSQSSNVVDIFNSTSQTWSNTTLSQARYYLAASSIGEIVAFGGGWNGLTDYSVVDMLNVTSNTWFTVNLSQARYELASTSLTNKIFFGGGSSSKGFSNVVDFFCFNSNCTLPSPLPTPTLSTAPTSLFLPTILPMSNLPLTSLSPVQNQFSIPSFNQSSLLSNQPLSIPNSAVPQIVVGIVVGFTSLLIAVGVILFILLRRKKKKEKNREQSIMNQKGEVITIDSVMNAIVSDAINKATLSTTKPGIERLKELSPSEIPLNELEIGSEVGSGTYGRVYVGKWKNKYQVALKFCQNREKIDEFMREANLMISLPPHPNVVQRFGVCIEGTQPIIVMEYCSGGSLDKLLFDKRQTISNEKKIEWIHEIANGMCHLHKFNIVHRDLASRNILLTHSNPNTAHLKISDFGMSRVLQKDIEGKTTNPIGPACWMSPESIGQQVYSKKSDVWMFGIVVYEIVSRQEPHSGKDPLNVSKEIKEKGLTPEIPSDCPQKLRELMEMCWKKEPSKRPDFESICSFIHN